MNFKYALKTDKTVFFKFLKSLSHVTNTKINLIIIILSCFTAINSFLRSVGYVKLLLLAYKLSTCSAYCILMIIVSSATILNR